MEHNLGLTVTRLLDRCRYRASSVTPLRRKSGERRAYGAAPYQRAARLLDKVIETMYETGKDMNAKYRKPLAAAWQ